jgi:hypothetical protein
MTTVLIFILFLFVAPFVVFFCGKWGAVGWFRGKYLAENKFSKPKEKNTMDDRS